MIVYTGGTFDLLHVGHLELLAGCRRLADQQGGRGSVIVSLNRDEFVDRYKGHPPVQPFDRRRELVLALRDVDAVVTNIGDEDSRPALEVVKPDVIAIGDDWLDRDEPEPDARYFRQLGLDNDWLKARGLWVAFLPRTRGTASSALR